MAQSQVQKPSINAGQHCWKGPFPSSVTPDHVCRPKNKTASPQLPSLTKFLRFDYKFVFFRGNSFSQPPLRSSEGRWSPFGRCIKNRPPPEIHYSKPVCFPVSWLVCELLEDRDRNPTPKPGKEAVLKEFCWLVLNAGWNLVKKLHCEFPLGEREQREKSPKSTRNHSDLRSLSSSRKTLSCSLSNTESGRTHDIICVGRQLWAHRKMR